MAVENQVEDFYVKGMMAFSGKEYKKAYAYWRKVLELDPDHQEAQKGILQIKQMKTRKSPKEVLQEIKALYAQKEYDRSLKLCQMLVNKFPDNKDLIGLQKKIELRIKNESGKSEESYLDSSSQPQSPMTAGQGSSQGFESTMYIQQKAEASLEDDSGVEPQEDAETGLHETSEVDRLIQQGVTLYEIQDFEQALVVWKKALELDPGNKVALDYIEGVQSQVGSGSTGASEEPKPSSEPNTPPSKEELVAIYNEGKSLYKEKKFAEALENWNRILEFFPNHKETLLCVDRVQKALAEDEEHLAVLAEAETAYSAGNYSEAERLILPVIIKAPHLEGPQRLKEALEERKLQITEIRNLEKEESFEEMTAKASDDEITRYFTPAQPSQETSFNETTSAAPKMVVSAAEIMASERKIRRRYIVALAIVIVIGLSFAGYWAYMNRVELRERIIADAPVKVTIPRTIKWYSNEARVNDYMEMASEFKSLGDYLLAYCSYDKVVQLSDPAINELIEQKDTHDALIKVRKIKDQALEEKEKARKKVVPEEYDKDAFEEVLRGWTKEDAESVAPLLRAVVSNNIDDLELREYLAKAEGQIGFQMVKDLGTLDKALASFKRASILGKKGNRYRGHYKVIQLFYTNAIDDHERRQWFFLFSEI